MAAVDRPAAPIAIATSAGRTFGPSIVVSFRGCRSNASVFQGNPGVPRCTGRLAGLTSRSVYHFRSTRPFQIRSDWGPMSGLCAC